MIIVQSKGGLGNQLFQFALYSALRSKVECHLDTSWHETTGRPSFQLQNLGSLTLDRASLNDVRRLSSTSNSLGDRIRRKFLPKATHFIEDQTRLNEEVWKFVESNSTVYLDGYWQSQRYFETAETELMLSLKPKATMDRFRMVVKDLAGGRQTVAVHVRRGDYLTDAVMYPLDSGYYVTAMEAIRSSHKNVLFVVCSDDVKWCKETFRLDDVVVVDWTSGASEDLYLMACCDKHIIANSSFGWWSAYLSERHGVGTVYPRHWFKKRRLSEQVTFMFPPDWVAQW